MEEKSGGNEANNDEQTVPGLGDHGEECGFCSAGEGNHDRVLSPGLC